MPAGMLLFLAVFFGLWGAMNYWVYANLAQLGWHRGALAAAVWALALAFPAARLAGARWRIPGLRVLYWVGSAWMGTAFLFAFWFFLAAIARSVFRSAGLHETAASPLWPAATALAVALMAAWAAINAARGPRETAYRVDRRQRYGAGRKVRIVQISDVHLGLILGVPFLRRLVDRINALRPDVVLITGDLFDPEFPDDAGAAAQLRRLRAADGVFAVSGNHEFYSGIGRFGRMMETAGVKVLDSEAHATAGGLQVAGLHDHTAERFGLPGVKRDLKKTLHGIDGDRPSVLLAHQPKGLEPAVRSRIDLVLSGHTHAGQIFPFWLVVRLAFRYMSGRYRLGPDTDLIVNTGTGFWGPPMRLGTRSQIVVVDFEY